MTFTGEYAGPSTTESLEVSGIGTVMAITSANGVRFNVRLIRKGDRFGREDCLTVGEGPLGGRGEPMVEFYDARFVEKFGPLGQFVGSRYYVDTILGRDGYGTGQGGLDLQGDVDAWKIDGHAMALVRLWLQHEIGE